nr:vegetative cell wall protein gp1-like [Lolium perenne]
MTTVHPSRNPASRTPPSRTPTRPSPTSSSSSLAPPRRRLPRAYLASPSPRRSSRYAVDLAVHPTTNSNPINRSHPAPPSPKQTCSPLSSDPPRPPLSFDYSPEPPNRSPEPAVELRSPSTNWSTIGDATGYNRLAVDDNVD